MKILKYLFLVNNIRSLLETLMLLIFTIQAVKYRDIFKWRDILQDFLIAL